MQEKATITIEDFSNKSYESLSQLVSNWIDIPQSFRNILEFRILNNPLIDWIMAIFIFIVIFLFRKKLINLFENVSTVISQNFKTPLSSALFQVIYKPLRWKILLIAFTASYAILDFSKQTNKIYYTLEGTLNIILLGWTIILLINFFHKSYKHFYKHNSVDMKDTFVKLSVTAAKVLTVTIIFMMLLQTWGYDIKGLLASLGLVGMAIALAAKDSARHIFGSIMIFTDSPFKVGDWIKTQDVEGTIEEIGMRSTKVRTFAQALVAVPNGNLADSAILNWSKMGKRRVKMTLGLTYSTSSAQMQNILKDIRNLLKNDKDVHQQTIHIYFSEFADSHLGVFCYFFTKSTDWGEFMRVRERLYLEIMKIVEDNQSSFAFPSQSIYIEEKNMI